MATIPITVRRIIGQNAAHPPMRRLPQNAGSSAKMGVPVLMTSGMVDEAATINDANDKILGFSTEVFQNLTTDAVPKHTTEGSVPMQTNAVVIPGGARPSDGKIGVVLAMSHVEFIGRLKSDQSVAATAIGDTYGLTKDANGQWYVDTSITAAANGACLKITQVIDVSTLGGLVAFTVLPNRYQWEN